jgi:hypothetical protein
VRFLERSGAEQRKQVCWPKRTFRSEVLKCLSADIRLLPALVTIEARLNQRRCLRVGRLVCVSERGVSLDQVRILFTGHGKLRSRFSIFIAEIDRFHKNVDRRFGEIGCGLVLRFGYLGHSFSVVYLRRATLTYGSGAKEFLFDVSHEIDDCVSFAIEGSGADRFYEPVVFISPGN